MARRLRTVAEGPHEPAASVIAATVRIERATRLGERPACAVEIVLQRAERRADIVDGLAHLGRNRDIGFGIAHPHALQGRDRSAIGPALHVHDHKCAVGGEVGGRNQDQDQGRRSGEDRQIRPSALGLPQEWDAQDKGWEDGPHALLAGDPQPGERQPRRHGPESAPDRGIFEQREPGQASEIQEALSAINVVADNVDRHDVRVPKQDGEHGQGQAERSRESEDRVGEEGAAECVEG